MEGRYYGNPLYDICYKEILKKGFYLILRQSNGVYTGKFYLVGEQDWNGILTSGGNHKKLRLKYEEHVLGEKVNALLGTYNHCLPDGIFCLDVRFGDDYYTFRFNDRERARTIAMIGDICKRL